MATLEAGAPFGPYRLIRPLGRGGFAEVWEAESLATGRQVALKILTELRAESERGLERLARSLVAWSRLLVLLFWTDAPAALGTALELVVLVGVAQSVYRPDRGPADRIVGTVLVPK